jgi:hypothetical protein
MLAQPISSTDHDDPHQDGERLRELAAQPVQPARRRDQLDAAEVRIALARWLADLRHIAVPERVKVRARLLDRDARFDSADGAHPP